MYYDRVITIFHYTQSRNAHGEVNDVLVPFLTNVRANVNYRGGRTGFYARQVVATGDVTFTIRYLGGVNETMYIAYNGRMYQVRHIEELGRKEKVAITATMHDNMQIPQ